MDKTPIYTVGYGTRKLDEFVNLLQAYQIAFLIDVRSYPQSRFKPEFARESLRGSLEASGITYVFMGDTLGGRPEDRTCYTNGKVDYAKLRSKPYYKVGISRLRTAWEKDLRVALMCSEEKPERCHRSKLIAESLVEKHIDVVHIDETGTLKTHEQIIAKLTAGQLSLFGETGKHFSSNNKYVETPKDVKGFDMQPKIVTIGVYDFTEENFFKALLDANVDTFCDLRAHRGMRGRRYAFVNSTRLQQRLKELGIKYLHFKELAPSKEVRNEQRQADQRQNVRKRERTVLNDTFIDAYKAESLSGFNSSEFIEQLGIETDVAALFCVEKEPYACHRSIVAKRLAGDLGIEVEHITP